MNKFWYVVQNMGNTEQKEYLIGFSYGNLEATEREVLDSIKVWCKGRNFRLALLIQVFPVLPIVNRIFPFVLTDEAATCLEHVMQAILNSERE